jgi:16S rRNA processing protein RimM
MMKRRICLGAFAGAHGVRGEVKVKTFTETEDGVARYGPVESEDASRRFKLTFMRAPKPGFALVRAEGIGTREEAAALTGVRFYVGRDQLGDAAADEFFVEDLVGLVARDETGAELGQVAAVHNFGAGDVIELKSAPARAGAVMVPFTRDAVPEVDIKAGCVTIARAALAEFEAGGEDESGGG